MIKVLIAYASTDAVNLFMSRCFFTFCVE